MEKAILKIQNVFTIILVVLVGIIMPEFEMAKKV